MTTLVQRMDDWMNPIVVKELRQAVAGRFVATLLVLFLLLQLLVIGVNLLATDSAAGSLDSGYTAFMVLRGILLGATLLFIPIYAAARFAAERSDTNIDLLYVTTIRPFAIVWGKFCSAMIIVGLIYSACLPFVSLTYLLRGIDLPTILLTLCFDMFIVAGAVAVALLLACLPVNLAIKAVLGLLLALQLLGVFWTVMMLPLMNVRLMGLGIAGVSGSDFLWSAGVFVIGMVLGIGFSLTLCVSIISPPASNRTFPLRMYALVVVVVSGGVVAGASAYAGADLFVGMWLGMMFNFGCFMLMLGISERREWGGRVLNAVPRRLPGRIFAFVTYSGSPGGMLFGVILLSLVLAASWLLFQLTPAGPFPTIRSDDGMLHDFVMLSGYAVGYSLTGLWLTRRLQLACTAAWAVTLILLAAGTLLPYVVAYFINPRGWHHSNSPLFITVPFHWIDHSGDETGFIVGIAWAVFALLINVPWLISRWNTFRAPDAAIIAK